MRIVPGTPAGHITAALDIPAIYLILILTYFVRFDSGYIASPKGIPEFSTYSITFGVISLLVWFVLSLSGQYQRGFRFTAENSWHLTKGVVLTFLLLTSFAFFYREIDYSRTTFLLSLGLILFFLNFFYLLKDRIIRQIAPASFRRNNVMIIGTGERAIQVYETMKENYADLHLCMIGGATIHLPSNINYVGPLNRFKELLSESNIDQVIIALPDQSIKKAMEIISTCENKRIRFSVIPDLFEVVTQQVSIGNVHGVPVMTMGSNLPIYGIPMRLKRLFDFILATLSLIVFFPFFLLIWAAIKLEDGGPVLYTQERVGLDGKTFKIYKFRSMGVDAEKTTGPMWAVKGDNRWTRVGTLLRKTSVDELPQLLNVIQGNMSLVGPRPERPVFVNDFKNDLPGYMIRHKVLGGITGWAQCNGLRGQSSIEDRTTYDLHYVENWSLLFDVRILFQTVFKMVFIQSGY
jgi:exopolysaccharide biosynthesis polyprenyl glycosylphosphotransferase